MKESSSETLVSPSAAQVDPLPLPTPRADQRFELRVTERFLHALDHLAESENISRADIVRRAVGLYALARSVEARQDHLAFAKLNDENVMEITQLVKL